MTIVGTILVPISPFTGFVSPMPFVRRTGLNSPRCRTAFNFLEPRWTARVAQPSAGCVLHCGYVKLRRFAVAAIVAICIGGPIVEMFDQWDHTLQDGNDTEANVVIAALCIGVAVAIGTIAIVARIRALSSTVRGFVLTFRAMAFVVGSFRLPVPTTSSPTPLRV